MKVNVINAQHDSIQTKCVFLIPIISLTKSTNLTCEYQAVIDRKISNQNRIIFISGNTADRDVQKCRETGAKRKSKKTSLKRYA